MHCQYICASCNAFASYICYLKLKYLHTNICIANTSVQNDLMSYIFSGITGLMIYFVGTFSFIMSPVSILFFLQVPRKHVFIYSVTSCWILYFTSQVHLLLTCYASYLSVNFLYSHCLLLSRQRLNYRLHDLFMFLLQQRCHVKMRHMISMAWRCGIWWYQWGEDEDPFSQILLFRPLNWMISKLLKSDLFWAWCYVYIPSVQKCSMFWNTTFWNGS